MQVCCSLENSEGRKQIGGGLPVTATESVDLALGGWREKFESSLVKVGGRVAVVIMIGIRFFWVVLLTLAW
ncbi:hypothetical protein [Bartonella sp. CB178]|uniref:hypothetical protein n=1 Tax=Bartonella sp. CB178 TaxID=3112255 RepID=UPI00300E549B